MAKKQIENYQPLVPQDLKRVFKKAKMRNFIGYLVCQWVHHSDYRALNNDWFFIPSNKMVEDTGLSKHTIMNYEAQLIDGGYIEKKAGNFATGKANEYFLTFKKNVGAFLTETAPIKNCTDNKNQIVKTAPINCTEGGIDNEEVNEKTAPINFEQNCTTDTDTDTEIDKETINIENDVMNKELVTEEKEHNDKNTKTEINNTESINEAYHHFFNEGFKGGIYEKVIKDVASSDDHRKTLWERWDIYCKWMKDGKTDISFKKMEQCLNAFLYLIEREYTEPVNIKNKKLKCHHVYNALMKVFFLRQWKRFISNLNMYEPQDCKKTRVAFFDKVVSIYQDDEEREKTVSQMELEYAEAYKATKRNPKLKYEELDPDLKYQNLDETVTSLSTEGEEEVLPFTSTVQAVEKEATKTVSDMFNKVHAEWVKLKREYTNRGLSVPPEDVVKFINKVESMGYLTDYDLKVLHELVQEN